MLTEVKEVARISHKERKKGYNNQLLVVVSVLRDIVSPVLNILTLK